MLYSDDLAGKGRAREHRQRRRGRTLAHWRGSYSRGSAAVLRVRPLPGTCAYRGRDVHGETTRAFKRHHGRGGRARASGPSTPEEQRQEWPK